MKKKTIRAALARNFTLVASVVFITVFVITFMVVKSSVEEIKINSITEIVDDSVEAISLNINGMYNTARAIAADQNVYSQSISYEEKKPVLVSYAEALGINSIGYVTAEGYLTSTDGFENDISTRDYFVNLMKGIDYISNPSFNTATQKQIIFIGVPLYEEGKIVGAITCTFDSSYLSDIISNVKYLSDGEAYLLSSAGVVIASPDIDQVLEKYNVITAAEEDPTLKEFADFTTKMLESDTGNSEYNDEHYFYQKVANSNGWTIVFKLNNATFSQEISVLIRLFNISALVALGIFIGISLFIGHGIGKRLEGLRNRITVIASGDFCVEMDPKELKRRDEIGQIYESLGATIEQLRDTIGAVKGATEELSESVGTLENATSTLSAGTKSVEVSLSEMQSRNSNQSQEIFSINEKMEQFTRNIELVTDNIAGVVQKTSDATAQLQDGSTEITNLNKSFSEFKENFTQFQSIIRNMNESLSSVTVITSTIGDIASQTNLLALNASIEAARAGEFGRGFSVVAQEIGALADQSSSSAGKISDVVKRIVDSGEQLIKSTKAMDSQIESQQAVIDGTLVAFDRITEQMNDTLPRMQEIADISNDNMVNSKLIGDSLQSANAISEELVATTVEVGNTSQGFADASNEVDNVSAKIRELSQKLSEQTDFFHI